MAHGDFTHLEIPAEDVDRAQRFYAELFGWQFQTAPGYEGYPMFTTPAGEDAMGGAIGKRGEMAPEQMRPYVTVDSIDATMPRLRDLGGEVVEDKSEVPGIGYYAVFRDTEGNELGLWERPAG